MYREDLKFSLWADFIERDYLDGEFKELIDKGIINGATSNPAIFKSAILNSPAYKTQLDSLQGLDAKAKYEALAIYDITKAADILRPLFDTGDDGYVSIEVDPFLCDDAEATFLEGKRLFETINRPNVMIKVPATNAGYEAMERLTSLGIPVTLIMLVYAVIVGPIMEEIAKYFSIKKESSAGFFIAFNIAVLSLIKNPSTKTLSLVAASANPIPSIKPVLVPDVVSRV
jgi:transaldolase